MIKKAGGIPIGIFFPDNKFNMDVMKLCDGFLFTGGGVIESSQVQAVHYAITNNRPILGICLGMQTIAAYEWFKKTYGDKISYEIIEKEYKTEFENLFLERKEGHNNVNPFYTKDINKSKHGIKLSEGTLFNIFSSNYIFMPSVHSYIVKKNVFKNSDLFKITGISDDGVIEAIEGDNFKIGVQFHPEIEKENIKLFEAFVMTANQKN